MNKLQKEFEKTGYNSWVNSDIYPDGKIYTKEYTEWLEKRLVKLLDLPHVSKRKTPTKSSGSDICEDANFMMDGYY